MRTPASKVTTNSIQSGTTWTFLVDDSISQPASLAARHFCGISPLMDFSRPIPRSTEPPGGPRSRSHRAGGSGRISSATFARGCAQSATESSAESEPNQIQIRILKSKSTIHNHNHSHNHSRNHSRNHSPNHNRSRSRAARGQQPGQQPGQVAGDPVIALKLRFVHQEELKTLKFSYRSSEGGSADLCSPRFLRPDVS